MSAARTAHPKAKAYSYTRYSTPEQGKGDSLRRQTEAARAYAAAHDLELDETRTIHDAMSAFKGKNLSSGALGVFLQDVRNGDIGQGAYLLVENLDRVSRQDPWTAMETIRAVISAGINLVDLSDRGGTLYNNDTLRKDPMAVMLLVVGQMRANAESARKQDLLRKAYSAKRAALDAKTTVKPFTRRLPAWLDWDDDKARFVLVKDRVKLLREIFRKADAGWGKLRIARWLNERGEAKWGKAKFWHASYIQKLLTFPAVVGTFIPHETHKEDGGRRTRSPLKPREGYFPAAIDTDLFERVRAQASATAPRGRNASREPRFIFAGLIKCAKCGSAVTRVSKGEPHVYLVCSRANAKAKGCEYHAVPYEQAERAMLGDNARIIARDAPRGMEAREIDAEIDKLEREAEKAEGDAINLAWLAARGKSETARRELAEKEAERERLLKRARELRIKRETVASASVKRRLEAMRDALTKDPLDIAEANTAMKQVLKAVVMDAEARTLTLRWHHSDLETEGPPIVPLLVSGWQRKTRKRRGKQ